MRDKIFILSFLTFLLTLGNPVIVKAAYTRSITFPVAGPHSFSDTFAAPRSGDREHEAIDIMAAKMTPVVAAVNGRVTQINRPEKYWGYAIYIQDAEGWTYAYLHLNNDTPGTDDGLGGESYAYAGNLQRADNVMVGQVLGWVGDSGNAENTVSHLHFEMRDPTGAAINPYESLLMAQPAGSGLASVPVTGTLIIVPLGGEVVKYANDPKVYVLNDNHLYHIYNEYSFNVLGFNWNEIRIMPATELYNEGLPLRFETGFLTIYEDGTPVTPNTSSTVVPNHYVFTQTLALGSRSLEVSELQRVLKQLGYFTYPTITDYFGSITRAAVIAFQRANGIDATGIVGPQTRGALNSQY